MLWVSLSLLNRDAMWVYNKEEKKEQQALNTMKTINVCEKSEENEKTNVDLERKSEQKLNVFFRSVVLVIKYTTNNNKSDTWHEKYNDIITEILHFCLLWIVERGGGVEVVRIYSDPTRITKWFGVGMYFVLCRVSLFLLVWNVIFCFEKKSVWLLILCGCRIAYLWAIISFQTSTVI